MKKFTILGIFVALAVIGFFLYPWAQDWYQFRSEKRSFYKELSNYYQKNGSEAAWLALRLANPYVEDKDDYAKYVVRIQKLDDSATLRSSWTLPTSQEDSYGLIMGDLALGGFNSWAFHQLVREPLKEGTPVPHLISNDEILARVQKKSPQPVILAMHQSLQVIGIIHLSLLQDDFSKEDLSKARQNFAEGKAEFEKALAQAKKRGWS